jgi:long-chain acyl-CoA synthetase
MKSELVCWGYPDRPALVTQSGEVVTYGQLREHVRRCARSLPAGDLVFLVGQNDFTSISLYLACLEVGAVPLLLSRDLSPEAFLSLFRTYRPAHLILPKDLPFDGEGFDVRETFGEYVCISSRICVGPMLHPDLAVLLATSGSTGSPKLVRLSLVNIVANARSIVEYLGIGPDERAVTSLPFNYSYGLSVVNSHLNAAASLAVTHRSLVDPGFWQQVSSQRVTSMAGVPYSYDMLLRLRWERMDLPSLRTMTQAGGRMETAKKLQVHEVCKSRGMDFFSMYGQTEATARIAYVSPAHLERRPASIGGAIPGGRLWVEDEAGNCLDVPDEVGELVYSGPNVALGYATRREDLARGDDWQGRLRTGDLARRDADGFFFIEGRRHRFLKVFGVRVSLDSVEDWFSTHGLVAAAHGRDDMLRVSVELGDETDLRACAHSLARALSIHPTALRISSLAALPRLSSGKVDYPCLSTM